MSLIVRLRLLGCGNPRQRRLGIEAIVDKLHTHFNASVAEVGREQAEDEVILAATCVARTRRQAREILGRIADALASHPGAALLSRPRVRTH